MDNNPFNPEDQHYHTGYKVVAALERIAQTFRVMLWDACKDWGLSPIQWQMLIFMRHHGPAKRKVGHLAAEFNLTKATISDSIRVLEKKGLISRIAEPGDSRSSVLHLTPEGERVSAHAVQYASRLLDQVVTLPADDQARLLHSLLELIARLNQTGVIAVQRMCFTCVHYRKGYNEHAHYCSLMGTALQSAELRIDCPEHELAGQ